LVVVLDVVGEAPVEIFSHAWREVCRAEHDAYLEGAEPFRKNRLILVVASDQKLLTGLSLVKRECALTLSFRVFSYEFDVL
jgi:hypothetical protein